MPLYETARQAIVAAGNECGLTNLSDSTDVYASTDLAIIQLRNLLTSAGRELLALNTWQRLIKQYSHTIVSPGDDSGELALPDDFGYMIPQTAWTPTNAGIGMPLAGPLSPQDWTYLVNSGLATSTIYVSFRQSAGTLNLLPIPPPLGVEINYQYIMRTWVIDDDGTTYKDRAENNDDTILYIPILIQKFLKLRFLEAKGFDTTAALGQFQTAFMQWTGNDISAPVLNMARSRGVFPYLGWRNIPDTNYGA